MENKTPNPDKIAMLLSIFDEDDLKEFADRAFVGYSETLDVLKPQINGRECFYMIGVVIVLRQLADNITESMEHLGIPMFPEMTEIFGKTFGFKAVSYTRKPQEDEDGQDQKSES
jgi:hypothetical protein